MKRAALVPNFFIIFLILTLKLGMLPAWLLVTWYDTLEISILST